MRLQIIKVFFLSLIFLITMALFYMQVIRGKDYFDKSMNNRIRVVSIDGPRGRILDRHGEVLADNRPSFSLGIISQDIQDKEELFNYLGKQLGKSPQELMRQFSLRRKTPFTPVILAEDIPKELVMRLMEDKIIYPGIYIQEGYERFYPRGVLGAHILGYVGKIDSDDWDAWGSYGYSSLSMVGKSGLEKSYENTLHGESGGRQIEINSRGQEVRLLGFKDPLPGKELVLTIDQRLQDTAYQLLQGQRGAVVVMDLSNGAILAMASAPSYDPNVFVDKSRRKMVGAYLKDTLSPLLNRAVSGQYPPGSVFKIPVALAAIERHKVTPRQSYQCLGYYQLGKTRFGCAHVHDSVDLDKAIAQSCNVYFFHMGKLVTPQIMGAYAKAFGLSRRTGVDLPFEAKGRITTPQGSAGSWFLGNTFNFSIGQGDTLATPLQLTVLMGAVANDGLILRPRLAKAIDGKEIPDDDITRLPLVRLRDDTWRVVQKGLRSVVVDPQGTGYVLNDIPKVSVSGKTGTAQSHPGKPHHAWFAGYARSPHNNIAFCIFLEHGGSSANAVNLTKELLLSMQSQGIL